MSATRPDPRATHREVLVLMAMGFSLTEAQNLMAFRRGVWPARDGWTWDSIDRLTAMRTQTKRTMRG